MEYNKGWQNRWQAGMKQYTWGIGRLPKMHEAFGFNEEQFIWFGGYPGAATLIGDEARWKHYVSESLIEAFPRIRQSCF